MLFVVKISVEERARAFSLVERKHVCLGTDYIPSFHVPMARAPEPVHNKTVCP